MSCESCKEGASKEEEARINKALINRIANKKKEKEATVYIR